MLSITVPVPPDPDPHPRYEDYPTLDGYVRDWHMWRARRRDERLTPQETAVVIAVFEECLTGRTESLVRALEA